MKKLVLLVMGLLLLGPVGCKKKIDETVEEQANKVAVSELMNRGLSYMADGKYYTARKYFEMIIDNAPNSREFPLAKLAMADAYFFDVSTGAPDALAEYQSFLVYFPNSDQAPYAQYMIGMCYYSQVNSPDRDQSFTQQAIAQFEKLKTDFPDSPYVKLSQEKIRLCWQRLAEHEQSVGVFYYKTKAYHAAEARFRYLMENYKQYLSPDELEQTYYDFGRTLYELMQYDEAARYFRMLLKEFPDTLYRDHVREMLSEIESGQLQKKKEKLQEQRKEELQKRLEEMKHRRRKKASDKTA